MTLDGKAEPYRIVAAAEPHLLLSDRMTEFLQANWSDILSHIAQHVWLVLISIAIAIVIALPVGILITRRKRLRAPVLGIANVMQTIPSLALFGFLIPLPFIGGIGPRTAIVALVFYALLPIIRNTVTGILGVDQNVREAAVAMGMTDRQVLFKVELPLAMSVILTGVRVAVVITIGVAIIAAEVGAGGLGEYIFRGLRLNDNHLLLAGAVPSAAMALVADFGFGVIEKHFDTSVQRRRKKGLRTLIWAVVLIGVVTISLVAWRGIKSHSRPGASLGHVTVGSKDFTESNLLAEIVAQMLEAQHLEVDRRFDLGGNLAHSALVGGQIDLYPEYTGTAFTAILHHQPITDPKAVYYQVKSEYSEQLNLDVSPPLGFDNTFAILVRGEDARRFNLKTISDAAKYSSQWQAGFGHDFISRQDGYPGFSRTYGLRFAGVSDMALDLTYTALASHKVDMIAGNSTDGRIAALDLVQLEDDRRYFPPYEAVFMIRRDVKDWAPAGLEQTQNLKPRPLTSFVSKLAGAISTDEMRKLNYEVDGAKRDKKNVVHEWLVKKGFIQ
jgi:osmoprotectant transport system permease protein